MSEAHSIEAPGIEAPRLEVACFRPGPAVEIPGAATGPLADLRFAAKDLFDVAGVVTGGGNPTWLATHRPADATAPVIRELLDNGATLVGKTITDDLSCGLMGVNPHYGTPLNPRYPAYVPGGSSSGSASAVAAGLADFAIGTDTGGSIRVPASFCELYGLRPSHGLLSLNGCIPQAPSFDTCGWFARDAATLLRIGDVLLPDDGDAPAGRFVVAEDCLALVDDEVRGRFSRLFVALGIDEAVQLFGDVAPDAVVAAYSTLASRELWASHGVWFERENPTLAAGVRERFIQASQVTAAEVQAAATVRRRLSRALAALLADNKIVLFPTTHAAPLRRDASFDAQMQYRAKALQLLCPASMGRLPQLVIPAVHVDDAHVGLSLMGGFARDRRLLRAGLNLDEKVRAIA